MASTSVLDPFSTKPRETAVNPRNQVGGPMEYVGEVVGGALDEILKGPEGPLVNEAPTEVPESTAVPEVYKKVFSSGSIENFRQPDPQKVIEAALVQNVQQKTELKLENIARYGLAGATKQELATDGNYQPNYEGESVESKYNLVWVFFKRIGRAIKEKMKSSFNPFAALGKRTSIKAAVSGANDLLLNAQAQEGQSMTSSSGAVRGAG